MKTKPTTLTTVALTAAAVGLTFLGACTEENTPVSGPHVSGLNTPSGEPNDSGSGDERPFWNLARDLPSSAGFFIDTATGNVVVSFTSLTEGQTALPHLRSRLGWVLSLARRRKPHSDIEVRQVKFTFPQLRKWSNLLTEASSIPGVNWLGPDEIKNQVVLGINPDTDPGPIRALARRLGVPEEAVDFEVSGSYVTQLLLTDSIRPIAGGTQIAYGPGFRCTLSFPALLNGQRAFLTASHCSNTLFMADGTQMYQPRVPTTHSDSLNIFPIGFKVTDFEQPCPPTFRQTECSNADAAIWQFTLDTTPSNWVLGHIARPTYGCSPGPCNPVNLQIGSYFRANATQSSIPVGALVSMIGDSSGWSQAYVQKVGQTIFMDDTHALLGQVFANYGSGAVIVGHPYS